MYSIRFLASLTALMSFVLLTSCGGMKTRVASFEYMRKADVELSDTHKTMAVKVTGKGAHDFLDLERHAQFKNITRAPYADADLKVDIHINALRLTAKQHGVRKEYDNTGSYIGNVHGSVYVWTQAGAITATDKNNKQLLNSAIQRVPGKFTYGSHTYPNGAIGNGESALKAFGSQGWYRSSYDRDGKFNMNKPQIIQWCKEKTRSECISDLMYFVKQYESGPDVMRVYYYDDGKKGVFKDVEMALESTDKEIQKNVLSSLESIIANNYMDPSDANGAKVFDNKHQAALHYNSGLLHARLGNKTEALTHLNKAGDLDVDVRPNVHASKDSVEKIFK